jgi:hypothetical protein
MGRGMSEHKKIASRKEGDGVAPHLQSARPQPELRMSTALKPRREHQRKDSDKTTASTLKVDLPEPLVFEPL